MQRIVRVLKFDISGFQATRSLTNADIPCRYPESLCADYVLVLRPSLCSMQAYKHEAHDYPSELALDRLNLLIEDVDFFIVVSLLAHPSRQAR